MKRFVLPILLTLILAACTPTEADSTRATPQFVTATLIMPTQVNSTAAQATSSPNAAASDDLTRTDEQGVVMFAVTPLNFEAASDTLEFNVSMNTHSVDLSMDLAQLSTLTTDTGITIQPIKWDATPGGHHVGGNLIFPGTQNGKSILEGASKLTITIVNVNAASRVFEWNLK